MRGRAHGGFPLRAVSQPPTLGAAFLLPYHRERSTQLSHEHTLFLTDTKHRTNTQYTLMPREKGQGRVKWTLGLGPILHNNLLFDMILRKRHTSSVSHVSHSKMEIRTVFIW